MRSPNNGGGAPWVAVRLLAVSVVFGQHCLTASTDASSTADGTTFEYSKMQPSTVAATPSTEAMRGSPAGGIPAAGGNGTSSNGRGVTLTTARPLRTERPSGSVGPSIQIEAGFCDAADRCTCNVAMPAPCSADERYREMVAIRQRLTELDRIVDGNFVRSAAANVSIVTARVQALEESIRRQSVSVSLAEIDSVRKELLFVSSLLGSLESKIDSKVVSSLTKELDAILKQINSLENGQPSAVQADHDKELTDLRARLAKCKEESLSLTANPFPGDVDSFNKTRVCSTSVAIKIFPQVTHKWLGNRNHSWFRDAAPTYANGSNSIYEIRSIQSNVALHEWPNYDNYSSARSEYLFQTRCGGYISGRKHVMLGGFFYYYDYRLGLVTKLDLKNCKVTNTLKLPVEQTSINMYLHKEPTFADINYDETGMYVVYTHAAINGELAIAKVDPANLTVITTWETGRHKSTLGNIFFVCGRMYTTDSFTVLHLTGKQFGYDTIVGSEFLVNIDVESRFGAVYQLSYNPRDRMIMGVDNFHSVTYDVSWE